MNIISFFRNIAHRNRIIKKIQFFLISFSVSLAVLLVLRSFLEEYILFWVTVSAITCAFFSIRIKIPADIWHAADSIDTAYNLHDRSACSVEILSRDSRSEFEKLQILDTSSHLAAVKFKISDLHPLIIPALAALFFTWLIWPHPSDESFQDSEYIRKMSEICETTSEELLKSHPDLPVTYDLAETLEELKKALSRKNTANAETICDTQIEKMNAQIENFRARNPEKTKESEDIKNTIVKNFAAGGQKAKISGSKDASKISAGNSDNKISLNLKMKSSDSSEEKNGTTPASGTSDNLENPENSASSETLPTAIQLLNQKKIQTVSSADTDQAVLSEFSDSESVKPEKSFSILHSYESEQAESAVRHNRIPDRYIRTVIRYFAEEESQ